MHKRVTRALDIAVFVLMFLMSPLYLVIFMFGLTIALFMDSMEMHQRGINLNISNYWIDLMTGEYSIYAKIIDKVFERK